MPSCSSSCKFESAALLFAALVSVLALLLLVATAVPVMLRG